MQHVILNKQLSYKVHYQPSRIIYSILYIILIQKPCTFSKVPNNRRMAYLTPVIYQSLNIVIWSAIRIEYYKKLKLTPVQPKYRLNYPA